MAARLPQYTRLVLAQSSNAAASCSSSPSAPSSQRSYASAAASPRPARKAQPVAGPSKRSFHSSRPVAAPKNPYDVLGVDKKAPIGDIKKTYYQLAKKYHPDTNKEAGAKEKFIDIQAAYDLLSDDKKRAAFDSYGAASQDPNFDAAGGGSPFGGGGGFGGFQDFQFGGGMGGGGRGDLFESLFGAFGGGRSQGRNLRGDDIEASVVIDFLESCSGTSKTLNTSPIVECAPCTGSGMKAGAKKSQCKSCRGTGVKTFVIQSGFTMQAACDVCAGAGSSIPEGSKCGTCGGMGKVKERKKQTVAIPAGVDDGMQLRMTGAGDLPLAGAGPAGDLLIRVSVRESKDFKRQGGNLLHTAKIPFHTALLGGKAQIPTLEGRAEIKVRAGTQHGEQYILGGKGVTNALNRGSRRGDLIVEYNLEIPRSLTPEQRSILEAYADTLQPRFNSSASASSSSTSSPRDASSSSSSSPQSPPPSPEPAPTESTDPKSEEDPTAEAKDGEKEKATA